MPSINLGIGSGPVVDFDNVLLSKVHVSALVHNLFTVNRFIGATGAPWSVGRHLWAGCRFLALQEKWVEANYYALHDLHEGIVGDTARPVKHAVQLAVGGRNPITDLEKTLDVYIYQALGITAPNEEIREEVKRVDNLALTVEMEFFLQQRLHIDGLSYTAPEASSMLNCILYGMQQTDAKLMMQLADAIGCQQEMVRFLLTMPIQK